MKQLQLDEVVQRIEHAFGEELPITDQPLSEADSEILQRVLQNSAYHSFLQDQINRQIIRDYLVNAVMLGCISDESFSALSRQAVSCEGRSSLSLNMLMMSVEAANEIPPQSDPAGLKALRPVPGSPPHMVIVSS
ncbi:MAG: hypothetical protein IMF06_06400 [Proteobacteria bacterium]|nr:hypothetical protein [Pseudomonadota bacterium]